MPVVTLQLSSQGPNSQKCFENHCGTKLSVLLPNRSEPQTKVPGSADPTIATPNAQTILVPNKCAHRHNHNHALLSPMNPRHQHSAAWLVMT